MPVNNHVIVKEDDSYIIDLNSISMSKNNLIFTNITNIKETFLNKIQDFVGPSFESDSFVGLLKINLDRKINIFIKKMSKNSLLKKLVNDEDKDCLSIVFMPGKHSSSVFNIINKHNKVVLKIEYSLMLLLSNKKFSLNYKVKFLEIPQLSRNFSELEMVFFENTISNNKEVNNTLKKQLFNFNKMSKNLGINVVVNSNSIIEKELIGDKFKYSLLIRYVVGFGKVSIEYPDTSYISCDIQNFYKKIDSLWGCETLTELSLLMSCKRIVQKWLKTVGIIDTHLKIQPENSFEVGFDTFRLYFNKKKIFIKITKNFNLKAIKEQYIYTEETNKDPLYKVKDYIKNEKEILLLLDMLKI